jgi:hypothetical protein
MGRPPSRAGFSNTTQREICWWLANGCSKEEAARRAGLPDTYRLHKFTRTREFADQLREGLRDHMSVNLAPKAVKILNDIMSDDKVTPRVRVDAAKALLDRAGYAVNEAKKPEPKPADNALDGMTDKELEALEDKLERLAAKLDYKDKREKAETVEYDEVDDRPGSPGDSPDADGSSIFD